MVNVHESATSSAERHTDRQINRQSDKHNLLILQSHKYIDPFMQQHLTSFPHSSAERQSDRQINRQTEKHNILGV